MKQQMGGLARDGSGNHSKNGGGNIPQKYQPLINNAGISSP